MDTYRPGLIRTQLSEIRDNLSPDTGRSEGSVTPQPPLWTRGELALFHPYFHDDWADEFSTQACDDDVWGFGDMLSINGPGVAAWKTR
jgi:hypothetical protein